FVYLVRSHLASRSGVAASWLRGLDEPRIRDALTLIHEQPDHAWSVAALAGRVGMSRAAFAARFAELVGQTPIRYLTQWRVPKAAGPLRGDQPRNEAVARPGGYEAPRAVAQGVQTLPRPPPRA